MALTIARPSVASLALQVRSGAAMLSTATGFVVQHGGQSYLVTNWHVVSGKRSDTGAFLNPGNVVPDNLVILHNRAGPLGTWIPKSESLYVDGHPRWREHPTHGRSVDAVALALTDLAGVTIYAHDPWVPGPGVAVGVAGGVSIVGFPFGITGGGGLGVWVRGAIATEPALDFDGLPRFLVDSRTRPGQSGSPVIAYYVGGAIPMADGGTAIMGGPVEQFLGVYSGRINEESDLGFVWKPEAVRSIVESGALGSL